MVSLKLPLGGSFYLPNFFYGKEVNMKKILVAVITVVVLGACGLGLYHITNNSNVVQPQAQATKDETVASGIQVSADGKLVSYEGIAGETALDTLKRLTTVETKTYDFGEQVIAINGLAQNGSTGMYWSFYVNGQMASVGAGSYNSVTGDKIEWKLESF
jgi:hypothetical protein